MKTLKKTKQFWSLLILILSVLVTIQIYNIISNDLKEHNLSVFQKEVKELNIRIEGEFDKYMRLAYSTRALFDSSENVTRDEWYKFIQSQDIQNVYPGIQAIQFLPKVLHEDKEDYIQSVRNDKSDPSYPTESFTIFPEGDRDIYFPIDFNTPFEGNEDVFGFDPYSSKETKIGTDLSIQMNTPIASEPFPLLQDKESKNGVVVTLPVFENGDTPVTEDEREEKTIGLISMVFKAEDMMKSIIKTISFKDNIIISINDISGDSTKTIISGLQIENINEAFSKEEYEGSQYKETKIINVGGREWEIKYYSNNIELTIKDISPYIILILGLIASFSISLFVYSLIGTKEKARAIANELTMDLSKAKEVAIGDKKVAEDALQKARESQEQLEKLNRLMVDRELKMSELKKKLRDKE